MKRISWKVGGQQGEGIESTGELFSKALHRQGYFLYGYRRFSSRIKGGHTNNNIHISVDPVRTLPNELDILVAFDQESIDVNVHELHDKGIVIADERFKPTLPEGTKATLYSVPFTKLAREKGTTLMKNVVAVGATCAVINLNLQAVETVIVELFERKGDDIVQNNLQALQAGYEYMKELLPEGKPLITLEKADGKKRLFMIGNDAIALGAMAGGARIMAAYPITPASEIMEYLIEKMPKVGGAVIQTEDEIAAVTMAIGSNFAGTRAFTASAGPGLSLMMEAIGLSGMTETPLVVVDTQRGGPSTGLPTKQEQSDLMAVIYGSHGEIPKVVMAPSTIEEAFYDTVEAFNLAEEYQCPVILLSDVQLSLAKQTVEPFDLKKVEIRRGKLLSEVTESELKDGKFKRFELTESGISPRVIPGVENGVHHVTGLEHDETGRPNEGPENRTKQMDKRNRKLEDIVKKFPNPIKVYAPTEEIDLLVVGFGSTYGAIDETVKQLVEEGNKVHHLQIRLLHPFPAEAVEAHMKKAKRVLVVENNSTGQLANLIKMNVGYREKIRHLLKYDGEPFQTSHIYTQCRELLQHDLVNI